jgi:hypothetical protein
VPPPASIPRRYFCPSIQHATHSPPLHLPRLPPPAAAITLQGTLPHCILTIMLDPTPGPKTIAFTDAIASSGDLTWDSVPLMGNGRAITLLAPKSGYTVFTGTSRPTYSVVNE